MLLAERRLDVYLVRRTTRREEVARTRRPGEVRDAIVAVLASTPDGVSLPDIERRVVQRIGRTPASSVRSYLRLNTPQLFSRRARGLYALKENPLAYPYVAPVASATTPEFKHGNATLYRADCMDWLRTQPSNSVHAVVTDPPYGLFEYSPEQLEKLRAGRGGVWRIPPSFDGTTRAPLPRFTVLSSRDLEALDEFFFAWASTLARVIVPGANVIVASNPLLSYVVSGALARAGLERRGEIVRLVMTMRGGDRPKAAHEEFTNVSVMPRAMWEPWLAFRKPLDGRAQDNLRRWKTGGFRRPSTDKPFGDVIASAPTHKSERSLAAHPSLKPQSFLRQLVRGVLPLGKGIVLDPFAGSGSTLAAANAIGYDSIGVEKDPQYYTLAKRAIPKLEEFKNGSSYSFNL